MKKILPLLFLTLSLFGQTNVQKDANKKLSNGSIVVGDGTSITATGTGVIAATSIPGLTIATTAPLTGGGSLAANLTLAIPAATNSVNGYLTSADHTTFAAKQPAGNYVTSLTGDVSGTGPGATATTLATVNTNVGTFAGLTINGKGLVTGATTLTTLAGYGITDGVNAAVNDTNATGTIAGHTLTLGWTGTLAAGRLNSNVVQAVTNDTNITGSVATQVLTLGWTGTLAAGRLNSNVVQAVTNDTNIIGSVATQVLTLGWTGTLSVARGGTGVGTITGVLLGNGTSAISAATLSNLTLTGSTLAISASYPGQSSIVTVGTLTNGAIGSGFTAIPNSALANSSVTIGSTSISLGSSSATLAGLTSVSGLSTITGGAGNLTLVAGTGNSRTLIFQTTTSGGTATTFLTGNADQSATFASAVTISSTTDATSSAAALLSNGGITALKTIWAGVGGFIGASVTAPVSTDLTLTGGAVTAVAGASISVGQGGNGSITFTPKGTGTLVLPNTKAFRLATNATSAAPFNAVLGGSDNGDGTYNDVLYFGYNLTDGGSKIVNAQPAFGYEIESNWLNGGNRYLEAHLHINTAAGISYRPFSFQARRDDPTLGLAWTFQIASSAAGYFTVLDPTATNTLYSFAGDGTVHFGVNNGVVHLQGSAPAIVNDTSGGNISYQVGGGGIHSFSGHLSAIITDGTIKTNGAATYISAVQDFRIGDNSFSRVAVGDGGGGFVGGYNVNYNGAVKSDSTGTTAAIYYSGNTIYFYANASTSGGTSLSPVGQVTTTGINSTAIGATSPTTGAFTTLTTTSTINGMTVSKGAASLSTNVALGSNTPLGAITTGDNNTAVGSSAGRSVVSGARNSFLGAFAGDSATSSDNVGVGYAAALASTGTGQTAVGSGALQAATSGGTNVAVGYQALHAETTGGGNVGLGALAGAHAVGSNELYVDNQDRTNNANEKVRALLYGTFNATAASQTLAINAGTVTHLGTIATGDPTNGSGAWLLGKVRTGVALAASTTSGLQVSVDGTVYTLAILTTNP